MKQFLAAVVAIFAIFAGSIGCVIGIFSGVEWYQCYTYETATGMPTKYTGLRCYVQDGGRWYSWEEYQPRVRIVQ